MVDRFRFENELLNGWRAKGAGAGQARIRRRSKRMAAKALPPGNSPLDDFAGTRNRHLRGAADA
jgi:hypothetical protein